jgi:type IV pilus assembly protein PilE
VEIANREQQYFQATRAYANKATLEGNGYALPTEVAERYSWDVTVGSGTVPTYTITFTGTGAQASDGVLTLDQAGTKAPADKWKR